MKTICCSLCDKEFPEDKVKPVPEIMQSYICHDCTQRIYSKADPWEGEMDWWLR
jgi:hypothetical protein